MNLYVLVPLVACIVASAMTSVIIARDPSARRSRVAAAVLACAAVWALCDLLANLLANPTAALILARVSLLPILALPPLALQLLLEENVDLRQRYAGFLVPIWLGVTVMVPAALFSPVLISEVIWTPWGWMTQLGPLYILGFIPTGICVFYAFAFFRTNRRFGIRVAPGDDRVLAWIAMLLLLIIPVSEFLAPLFGIASPRLGALCVTVLGSMVWLLFLAQGEYAPPPSSFAREMLDHLSEGVALINREGRICAANATLAKLACVSPDDLTGGLMTQRLGISLDDLPGSGEEKETSMRRGDGRTIPVSITQSDLRDPRGARLGAVCVVRDFREVVRLRRQLVAAGRLAAVGELAAGVVHEVNNPIAFIQSNLHSLHENDASLMEVLQRELAPETVPAHLLEGHHLIGQSLQDIARVASIVKEVRVFSHMGPTGRQMNDVTQLIEDAVRIALPQLRARATLVRNYGDLPPIECAGQEIRQLLLDLILNAARSLDGMGTIRLTTFALHDMISFVIEDDGRGHTRDQVERIFDPNPTRSDSEVEPDLCVAYQIVRQHGGKIHLESVLGQGTTVSLSLPSTLSWVADAVSNAQRIDDEKASRRRAS